MNKLQIGITLFGLTNVIYCLNLFNYFIYMFDIVCIMELINAYNNNNTNISSNAFKFLYVIYCVLLGYLSYNVLIVYSSKLLLNIVLIANINDISQYAIGYNYGTHFVSTISPNKTYEGYIAGIGSVILYSQFINYTYIDLYLTQYDYIICFVYASLGDAISSYFKRQLKIKDWSALLGKQGGFLDRGNSTIGVMLYFITSHMQY
uniref:Phosphatidate cytidylyltransferase n=1 Tax=viral metagenome TaxID=1070528 RepID=A0A6C0IHV4_9ZZZZ